MIIGLVGYKRVGKSTAAGFLEESQGFTRHNMKDALVREMKMNLPNVLQEMSVMYYGVDSVFNFRKYIQKLFDEKPPLMRALMQNYGTEVRRTGDADYWVRRWADTLPGNDVVVDDVRFINEAQAVKDAGGVIVKIMRDDITSGGGHTSETEQDSIMADVTVYTFPGDIKQLETEMKLIVKNHR